MAINIKSRYDFIMAIFEFFRVDSSNNLVSTYDMALTTKFPVDWEAFYKDIIKTVEKRVLPMPKFFSDKVVEFKKINTETKLSNESVIRVILKCGQEYIFTVNNLVDCSTLKDVKKHFEYKDENNKIKTKIEKIIRYPKETTLIGDKVFFNVYIPKNANMTDAEKEIKIAEKEKELESQVRILFVAPDDN